MVEEAGEQHGDDDDDGGDTGGEGEGFASAAGVDIHSC